MRTYILLCIKNKKKNLDVVVQPYDTSSGEMETSSFLGSIGQIQSCLMGVLLANERACLKISWTVLKDVLWPFPYAHARTCILAYINTYKHRHAPTQTLMPADTCTKNKII